MQMQMQLFDMFTIFIWICK